MGTFTIVEFAKVYDMWAQGMRVVNGYFYNCQICQYL